MKLPAWARRAASTVMSTSIPPNPLHRLLAWEYRTRQLALHELTRVLYYQPMFESLCKKVGKGMRLELAPDSKVPVMWNCDLELGDKVRLNARTTFSGARNAPARPVIRIGDSSYIGTRVVLRAGTELVIGKHVLVAANTLLSGDPGHPFDAEARRSQPAPREELGRIEIQDDVWLAYNVSVLGNVTIGQGSVVAANSVVVKDVPPYSLVAGNPARVIRSLKPGAASEAIAQTLANVAQTAVATPVSVTLPEPLTPAFVDPSRNGVAHAVSAEALFGQAPVSAPAVTVTAALAQPESPRPTTSPEPQAAAASEARAE